MNLISNKSEIQIIDFGIGIPEEENYLILSIEQVIRKELREQVEPLYC
jgi:hypothetical protein